MHNFYNMITIATAIDFYISIFLSANTVMKTFINGISYMHKKTNVTVCLVYMSQFETYDTST